MPRQQREEPSDLLPSIEFTRRHVVAFPAALAAATMLRTAADRVAAAEGTPSPIAADRLQQLTELSRTLCGGGNFDDDRTEYLLQLLSADADLQSGFDELLATPPVPGQPFGSDLAHATAQTILLFWYADVFAGDPLPDRPTAYYQLTAWQAMYTPSWAVCKSFGGWADAPAGEPLVPANS